MRKIFFAVCLAMLPGLAHSATIALNKDGDWAKFRFHQDIAGGAWLEPNDNLGILSFTISLKEAAILQVTDWWLAGDRFEVFDNGVSLGLTSDPTSVGDDAGSDIDRALNDDHWSSGSWTLDAGDHTITGFVRVMPQEKGSGLLRVVSIPAVPVPGSLPLVLAAGMALGAFALRKRRANAKAAR